MEIFDTKVAVIGYGHLGKWHCEKAKNLANLVGIVEVSKPNFEKAKADYPDTLVVSDISKIIDDIDAAIIVTPTFSHFDLIKKLLAKDKHVFCEKPMCATVSQGLEIGEMLKGKNLVFQVGHSERFHQSWSIVEKYEKYIGSDSIIRMNRCAPFKSRATDVGVVEDLMIHDLDLLLYLFKESPIKVRSTGYQIRTNYWDYVCSEFVFESGRRAYVVASRNHVKEVRDLEVFSSQGCLYVDLFNNQIHIASQDPNSFGEYIESMNLTTRDHLFLEQEHFYESIQEKLKAIVTYDDGMKAVKLIGHVMESLKSGDWENINV